MKVFIFDLDRCNGCHNCQIACKDEHVDNDWSPIARPQPDTGQFWCKVDEEVCGKTPHVRVNYLPRLCNHCDDAPCMKAFPQAVYKRPDGLVIIDPEKAQGVEGLAESCPYGAIYWNGELGLAQKCTGCAHLLDDGWRSRAAWTRAARGPCGSARKGTSRRSFPAPRCSLPNGARRRASTTCTSRSASLPRRWWTKRPTRWSRGATVTLQRAEGRRDGGDGAHRRVRRRVAGRPRARPVPDVGAEGGLP